MRNPRSVRRLAAVLLLPWILVAAWIALNVASLAPSERLDVNGEPLSYNAPCSTDTDCLERFGY